jgi:hypothetical protein
MKENVYATEVEDSEDLRCIRIAAEDIRGRPRLFIDVRNSNLCHCEIACEQKEVTLSICCDKEL